MKFTVLLALMLCGFCCGCDAKDAKEFTLNLDHLNWQTGALIALAYFANSRGHFATAAQGLLSVLRALKILPAAGSKEALDAEGAAKLLAELYLKLSGHPELQHKLLTIMAPQQETRNLNPENRS